MAGIDDVRIDFSDTSLLILSIVLAIVMLGIAMDTKVSDFREVRRMPKAMAVGIAAQFILLPAITFCLTLLLDVRGSIAMGMILVASCPPGGTSNILTYRSGGNVALSVSMTGISSLIAIFVMPLNVAFWGGLQPEASKILEDVDLSALEMLAHVVLVIGIPFIIGLTIAHRKPEFTARLHPWVKRFSLWALVGFILFALVGNIAVFWPYIPIVALVVFLHDTLALGLGYGIAASFGLDEFNRRAITFEVGVRYAGLGLGMVFTFFDGIGGMALVAGWWGIWDLIAGLALSSWWARRPTGREKDPGPAPT
ncbi:MAG: bile acid:sodium symporter family protein [Solirubrobacterales bacterium]|nr:bile acid:sodium symporter family protein [Solirubrobacterales bacterium]